MKLTYLLAAFMLSFSACASPETPSPAPGDQESPLPSRTLHVLSYNIHHSNPPSRPGVIDLEAIAKVIRDSEAEIVGLQEVDVHTERSGEDLHMAQKLAEMTGLTYFYFSKGIDYQGGEYGTAILSKYPLSDTKTIMLPAEEGTEQRTLSVTTVTLEEGLQFQFANTHLDYTSASNVLSQAKAITAYFEEETMPILLTGDFNSVPTSDPIRHLDGFFTRTCRQVCAPTIPVNNPTKAIDFIMYRGQDHFKVQSHQVIQEKYASDHLPVLAVLELTLPN